MVEKPRNCERASFPRSPKSKNAPVTSIESFEAYAAAKRNVGLKDPSDFDDSVNDGR
jgi:hypothetical protein